MIVLNLYLKTRAAPESGLKPVSDIDQSKPAFLCGRGIVIERILNHYSHCVLPPVSRNANFPALHESCYAMLNGVLY